MIVQNIYYSLSIDICVRLKIASHLTHLETKVTCSSLQTCVCVAETCLHLVNDVLLPKLILVAHLDDVLLGLAAAVLQCHYHLQVTLRDSIDYSLCRITNLSAYLLDACLDAANRRLQCVEVAIQVSRQSLCGQIPFLYS